MPIMMLIVEILLIIGIKWKTRKQTENCRKKRKIPAANRKLATGKLKTFWKQQDLFCFFSKKLPSPLPNSRNRQKSGHQGGQTAPRWLDNTVKPCSKIGWRNCRFSTIQQRKKTVTSFFITVLWRWRPDLNWWMKVLQTFALPLGHVTIWVKNRLIEPIFHYFLERPTRLELATSTLARWRSTRWATAA